jgi:Reverse transcriptase (RNA-dependent DNA polymerase)
VAFLKGKTTASAATDHVPNQPPICLPPDILSNHGKVTLCCDLFYVLGLPFSLSVSRNVHFLSCRSIPNPEKPSISKCVSSDINIYQNRGFTVTAIHCDGEYNHVKPLFPNVNFNICAPEDHVPKVERAIRTVKDTIRSTIHGMPYHRLPRTIVKELAIDESAYDRNYIPPTTDPNNDHHLTTDAYTSESDIDDDDSDFDDIGHNDNFDSEPTAPAFPTTKAPETTENEERNENEERQEPTAHATATNAAPASTTNATPTNAMATNATPTPPTTDENEERETNENGERGTTAADENEERETTTVANEESPMNTPTLLSRLRDKRKSLRNKSRCADYTYRFGFTQIAQSLADTAASFEPHTVVDLSSLPAVQKALYGLLFTQMTAQKGIKKHGQAAMDALRKEFEQFRVMDVLEPLDAFTLTDKQKADSLRALSVIKEKRDGRLKGRTVADGSAQKGKFSKSETGSPTAASDVVILTSMIDAYKNRDVAVADVTGAYLHAHMKDFISMRFTGWAVDLLCDVNPEYSPFTVHEGKTKVLYVRCNKAIYGCVVSGMLWYELFSQTLEQHGFTINPYDFCVANATIDGTQCTIVWYVDDTKISHVKPCVVTNVIGMLESHFGKMSVSRGAQHEFLGMHLDFLDDGTATIHMPSYLQSAIDESGLPINKAAATPAAASLLHIEAASPLLPIPRARTFHSVVAKLIYAGTCARTDILLALGFLCSRVRAPTEQDERKLFRLLSYLFGTIDLKFHLGADSLDSFTTWVDASFAVHGDMRSHTGGVISFGRGGLICKSKKQSINTKSSTEAELVGASDYLPNTLFVKMFMAAQGYPITQAIFYQDNESAITMESNIRYFFITDHAKRSSITIEHCPTGIMLADYFTKPLQGSLFRIFRSVLLGELPVSELSAYTPTSGNEERVDKGNREEANKPEPSSKDEYRKTKTATAAADASHSFETYPDSK